MHHRGEYRQLEILRCPPAAGKSELKRWVLAEQSPYARRIPGASQCRIYIPHDESIFGKPFCDCFAEYYFPRRTALENAFHSTEMKSHREELRGRGYIDDRHLQIVWAEEHIIEIPGGPRTMHMEKGKFCQMGTLRRPPGMSAADLRAWWIEEHAETGKLLKGLRWYTVLFPLHDTPFGLPPFDGYASVWYDSVEELKEAAGSEIMKKQMEDVRRHNMDDPSLSKVVLADEFIVGSS
jgi:uncharacterized protein (TIGR02118 family)